MNRPDWADWLYAVTFVVAIYTIVALVLGHV